MSSPDDSRIWEGLRDHIDELASLAVAPPLATIIDRRAHRQPGTLGPARRAGVFALVALTAAVTLVTAVTAGLEVLRGYPGFGHRTTELTVDGWTVACHDVAADECRSTAGVFANNLAFSLGWVREQSGARLDVEVRKSCPMVPDWADGSSCWDVTAAVPVGPICMVIARRPSLGGYGRVGGAEMMGRAGSSSDTSCPPDQQPSARVSLGPSALDGYSPAASSTAHIVLMTMPSLSPGTSCNAAMHRGSLVRDAVSGLGLGGMPVRWPWGWTVVDLDGKAALYGADGHVVAYEGDAMEVGGSVQDGIWNMCGNYHVGLPYPTFAP